MGIQLKKGERFNLSKTSPSLTKVAIALGWEIATELNLSNSNQQSCDIDASVFALGADGKIPDERYFVFYNNSQSPDGSIAHSGDNQTGQTQGDDETIDVDLEKVTAAVEEMVFVVTIHDAQAKHQNFSQIRNAFIRLYDRTTGSELARYDLTEAFSEETAIEFGRLYKKDGNWRFQEAGQGYKAGLQSFVDKYHSEIKNSKNSGEMPQIKQVTLPKIERNEASKKTPKARAIKLEKTGDSHKINLSKLGSSELLVVHANLDWEELENRSEFWGKQQGGNGTPDLDLGCMYEMANGEKGVIQALGKNFGSKTSSPYIFLDQDDRTGATEGENMYILRPDLIKRVLFFGFIYSGVGDFETVRGRMFFKISNGEEVHIELDNPNRNRSFCGAAMIQNTGSQIVIVKKERYFKGHEEADRYYGFGFNWHRGTK
ncbi:TerD family protein [Microcoleus sp. S28C3]|uniref:TerD family protein n=1 Tax=Microcoleus sp. S28C3 TaxID=3055414 RepID=UPI002FD3E0D6